MFNTKNKEPALIYDSLDEDSKGRSSVTPVGNPTVSEVIAQLVEDGNTTFTQWSVGLYGNSADNPYLCGYHSLPSESKKPYIPETYQKCPVIEGWISVGRGGEPEFHLMIDISDPESSPIIDTKDGDSEMGSNIVDRLVIWKDGKRDTILNVSHIRYTAIKDIPFYVFHKDGDRGMINIMDICYFGPILEKGGTTDGTK